MKENIHLLQHSSLFFPTEEQSLEIEGFTLFRCDKSNINADYSQKLWDSFRSDFFVVFQVISGSLELRLDFKDYRIEKSSLLLVSINSVKKLLGFSDDCVIEGFTFTSDFLSALKYQENVIDIMEFFTSKFPYPWSLLPEDDLIFRNIRKNMQNRANQIGTHVYGRELLLISFSEFLFELGNIGKRNNEKGGVIYGRKEELVFRFIRLAMQHHITERNLKFYSSKLFVTSKHLSETTKEVTGKTGGMIIDEMNIMEAKRLLEETNLSIAEIAYRLQFANPAFFSKFFNRLSGHTPSSYRQNFQRSK